MANAERGRTNRQWVEELRAGNRRTAILGELAGVAHAVLAERLDIAPNALYKLSHDARRRLRASLEREGLTAEDVKTAFDASSKESA